MSSLYDIDSDILELLENGFNAACIDEETGVIDMAKATEFLEALQIERKEKIESIAVFIKNLESEAEQIKAEEKNLKARREAKENKAERLREYLKSSLLLQDQRKFETARVALSFRKTRSVEVENLDNLDEKYITIKTERKPDKTAIKRAIDSGETVDGAVIVEKQNLQIK